ncbi:MAG: transporter substrate-binding domain-containing protein [Actinomycetota bacterium]
MLIRLRPLAYLLALALGAGACVPPEPETFPRRFDAETYMAEIQRAGRLRIGIPEDAPPLGYVDAHTGRAKGLTVELGRALARFLRVEPDFRRYPSARLIGLVEVGGLDVAFPATPIDENLVRTQGVSDPYLVAHQRLLVPTASGIEEVEGLSGSRLCSLLQPGTGVDVARLVTNVQVLSVLDLDSCLAALRAGAADAITAEDFRLLYARRVLERTPGAPQMSLEGANLNLVGYGAIALQSTGFPQFVRDALNEVKSDGRWQGAYDRWIGGSAEPPTMTLEEAAALWPTDT